MNEPKEKTYTVLWGMCTATYYVVNAEDEDQAIERSGFDYDPDKSYPLQLAENQGKEGEVYTYKEPVQPPICPNYHTYLTRKKSAASDKPGDTA